MAKGFKHGGGGGGNPLNFEVVGGAMPFGYINCKDFTADIGKVSVSNVTQKRITVTADGAEYRCASYDFDVLPGQVLTFSAEVESGYTGFPCLGLRKYEGGSLVATLVNSDTSITDGKLTFTQTVPAGVTKMRLELFCSWSTAGSGSVTYKNVMMGSANVAAKENTIWVNTEAEITGWVFSAEEPAAPAEGMVWFFTPSPNTVAFDALKKNSIMVYPNAAKQYVSGAWKDVEAAVYLAGVWTVMDDTFWLYKDGTEFPTRTGDLVYVKIPDSSGNNGEPTVTRNSDNLVITGAQYGGARFYAKKINLTDFNKLCFEGTMNTNLYDSLRLKLGVWTSTTGNPVASKIGQHINGTTLEISVANLSGEHYVGFWIMDTNSKITVKKLWLE